jgi:hypothetical protein
MTKKERQHRIDYEVIIEAYDEQEVNMCWFYHFNDNLEFPISAVAKLKRRNGQYEKAEIQIVDLLSEEGQEPLLGMVLTMQGFVFPVSLKQIVSVDTNEENKQILNDWLFWKELQLLK